MYKLEKKFHKILWKLEYTLFTNYIDLLQCLIQLNLNFEVCIVIFVEMLWNFILNLQHPYNDYIPISKIFGEHLDIITINF
jgi:hypothetical protein